MTAAPEERREAEIRFEPNERPPFALSLGLALQSAAMMVAGIVLTPVIVIRAAGIGEPYLSWAVFAALAISGVSTILQAFRLGRVGAGHILLMGTSGVFIAVCVTALVEGGPGLLSTLVVISSLFQFALASRLAWLRRVITPVVAGTVIMLISVTVMPIVFASLADLPEGSSPVGGPASFVVTLVVIAGAALRGSGALRLWAPFLGIVAGSVVASFFGLYDFAQVAAADWVGAPVAGWPGLDLEFGAAFWALLPAFVFVTFVGAIETVGDSIAIQRVSWRKRRAPDYRVVQGAVGADGAGNFLSGLAGTVPNTTYSSSIAIAELTGVAARRIGVHVGAIFVGIAFFPKFAAFFLAIPNPVVAAYLLTVLGLLFVVGMRMVVQDGMDIRKATIVGISFWLGVGFQQKAIFADRLGEWWGQLLGNGMATGALAAILLTLFVEWTGARRRSLTAALDSAGPPLDDFLGALARKKKWNDRSTARLRSAGEEALLTLQEAGGEAEGRQMRVTARADRRSAELEFVAATGEVNLEDRLALLADLGESVGESEVSLRLLRHYASSVRHQKYHDVDIVTVSVETTR